MRQSHVSVTALGTAAMRAIESEKPTAERICYDPLARLFTEPAAYHLVKLSAGFGERRTGGALTFIVCRCRYFDDFLQDSLKSGTAQVVILGAGLDSRAYRVERLQLVKTFEVDHPATQASKIERVKKVLGKIPANVVYIPVDFNVETLDKLLLGGFDRSLKALFIWEGVTLYLTHEAVEATLSWVQANAAPGSAIIFDYQYSSALARRNYLYAMLSRVAGERRALGFPRGKMEDFLTGRGFTQVVEVDAKQLKHLYCTGANQGRAVAEIYAIVHAEVAGR